MKRKRTHENELERSRVLIEGVRGDDAMKTRIAPIYPSSRINKGLALYNKAKDATNLQAKEKVEGIASVKAFNTAKDSLHTRFVRLRNSIRYFYKSDMEMQSKTYLNEEIAGNYAQWSNLIERTFAAIADEAELGEKLAMLAITPEEIANWKADLLKIEQLKLIAEKEDGEAQEASVKKRETMAELKAFCSDLRECLKLYYHGSDRQALEKVGIVVK